MSRPSTDEPVRLSFDHALILVSRLPAAVADYRRLGFTVAEGGAHEGGLTHNALVVFEDGTYLELLAPTRPWVLAMVRGLGRLRVLPALASHLSPVVRRFVLRAQDGEGLIDFSLRASPLDAAINAAQRQNILYGTPAAGQRRLPDGRIASWRLSVPAADELPFLIEDLSPRSLRAPFDRTRPHPNGARGVLAITVHVHDIEASAARYRALLQVEPEPMADGAGVRFPLEGAGIALVAGSQASPSPRMGRPVAVRLRARPGSASGALDPRQAHGVPLALATADPTSRPG